MNKLNSSWEDVLSRRVWRPRGAWLQEAIDLITLLWDEKDVIALRKQTIAILLAITICLHILLIWLFLRGLSTAELPPPTQPGELQVSLSSTPSAPDLPKPTLETPPIADIQTPQIEMASQSNVNSIATDASSLAGQPEAIAPRPDPTHENPPFTSADVPLGLRIVLRVLIAPTGGVDDAQVSASCGQATLDQKAITFVKANWKFLPATMGANPVPFWTTILVPVMRV